MHPGCRNGQIFENIDAGEGFEPLNPPKSLAGAISMPCGAHAFSHMTRRVVAPRSNTGTGAIAQRKGFAPKIRLRCSRASGARTRSLFENPSGLNSSNMSWLGPLLISAPGVAHSGSCERTSNLGASPRIFEMSKFVKILTLVRGTGL